MPCFITIALILFEIYAHPPPPPPGSETQKKPTAGKIGLRVASSTPANSKPLLFCSITQCTTNKMLHCYIYKTALWLHNRNKHIQNTNTNTFRTHSERQLSQYNAVKFSDCFLINFCLKLNVSKILWVKFMLFVFTKLTLKCSTGQMWQMIMCVSSFNLKKKEKFYILSQCFHLSIAQLRN